MELLNAKINFILITEKDGNGIKDGACKSNGIQNAIQPF